LPAWRGRRERASRCGASRTHDETPSWQATGRTLGSCSVWTKLCSAALHACMVHTAHTTNCPGRTTRSIDAVMLSSGRPAKAKALAQRGNEEAAATRDARWAMPRGLAAVVHVSGTTAREVPQPRTALQVTRGVMHALFASLDSGEPRSELAPALLLCIMRPFWLSGALALGIWIWISTPAWRRRHSTLSRHRRNTHRRYLTRSLLHPMCGLSVCTTAHSHSRDWAVCTLARHPLP
jgi:hypothetical protein